VYQLFLVLFLILATFSFESGIPPIKERGKRESGMKEGKKGIRNKRIRKKKDKKNQKKSKLSEQGAKIQKCRGWLCKNQHTAILVNMNKLILKHGTVVNNSAPKKQRNKGSKNKFMFLQLMGLGDQKAWE